MKLGIVRTVDCLRSVDKVRTVDKVRPVVLIPDHRSYFVHSSYSFSFSGRIWQSTDLILNHSSYFVEKQPFKTSSFE